LITSRRSALLAAIVLSGLSVFGSPLAHAQEIREGIGVSPTSLTVNAAAGEEVTGSITVLNPGDKAINYRLYASNFSIRNEAYEKDFDVNDLATAEPASWFSLPKENRSLPSQGQEKVTYKIRVPPGAGSQGYYGVIFAETIAQESETTGVERRKRVGSLVYLTVEGDALRKEGELLNFETPRFQSKGPINAQLRFSNTGNVHYPVGGEIRLQNIFGRVIHTTEVKSIIIPDTTRQLDYELPTGQVGLYRIAGNVDFLDTSVSLGSHWVLVASPIWLLMWIVAPILVFTALLLLSRRRGRRGR